jgi:chorismate mutase
MEGDSMKHSVLEQALQAIEASDKRILHLLTLRRQLATQLSQVAPIQEVTPSLDERLRAVVTRLASGNSGPLNHQQLVALFKTVIQLTEPLCSSFAARNGAAKKG